MKKIFAIILLLVLISSISFSESVDQDYIDLIFDKFESYDDATKQENAELLDVLMGSEKGLDLMYKMVLETKKASMEAYGITEESLRQNIDALKTWNASDRRTLVSVGVNGDKVAVNSLVAKYQVDSSGGSIVTPPVLIEKELTRTETLIQKGLIVEAIAEVPELKGKTFEDTKAHWSNDHVLFLVSRGIISGKDENTFAPEANISKAEIITLVTKLIINDVDKLPGFTDSISDIETGKWYDIHMQRGYVLGLINENSAGILEPNHNSSREEVVEILIKAIEVLEIPIADEIKVYSGDFKDFKEVSETRKEAMTIAINLGFISGIGDKTLSPQSEIKRSEIAVVIKKLYLYILENMND